MAMKVKLQLNSKAKPSTKKYKLLTTCNLAAAKGQKALCFSWILISSEHPQNASGFVRFPNYWRLAYREVSEMLFWYSSWGSNWDSILKPLKRKTCLHSKHCSLISCGCRWQNIGELCINFCTGSFKMCHRKLQFPNILVELFFF